MSSADRGRSRSFSGSLSRDLLRLEGLKPLFGSAALSLTGYLQSEQVLYLN